MNRQEVAAPRIDCHEASDRHLSARIALLIFTIKPPICTTRWHSHDDRSVADPLDPHLLESSTRGRMSLYKNDEPRAGCTRDTDALSRGALYRDSLRRALRFVILKFSYPNFGMDPTTPPPDVGRHGYFSFRGCTSACWSPARATTGRQRSPSPTRGR